MLRIRDVYPGSLIPIFPIPDLGSKFFPSRIRIKEYKYFNPKKWFLSTQKYDLRCSSRIRILSFSHPESRGKKGTGSATLHVGRLTLTYSCRLSTSRCTWPSSTRRGRITTKRPRSPPPQLPACCLHPYFLPFRGVTMQAHTHTPQTFSCCWYYFMNMPTWWFFSHSNNVAYYIQVYIHLIRTIYLYMAENFISFSKLKKFCKVREQ